MFKHLLIPLDGSKLAEAALPAAAWLSQKLEPEVTLIHIIEQDAPEQIHGDRHLTNEEDACRYLDGVSVRYFGGKANCHVHSEKVQDVARSIADHSGELAPDLIVMCAHGAGGLRDLMVGSIAQQVIGMGRVPILLIQPKPGLEPQFIKKILIALDGDPEHESSLDIGFDLAEKLGAQLHLLMVVHTLGTLPGERAASGWMLPGATRAMLDIEAETANEHLESLAMTWRTLGLHVACEVRRGDPAQQITAGARAATADLIVLSTHGKSGLNAFWSSSVAPKVVTSTPVPLLLLPVRKLT